ncbi:MAG: MoxR family ATPase, partial [Elusimicrobiota bacterium]|nr:MoxR family ATPase [Elusimicrobiota bacterium]
MKILNKLGIYGLDEIEDIIIAGLVTGDPVLLIGKHGSAKTLLVRRIAQSLGYKFIAYDASKALFDDVVGFPNPQSLCEGTVDYISTPISIWDKEFVLIDEISRATPSMQNKWLEIIRSRQLMGKPVPNLKYVFAAMNPPVSYVGSIALDVALAGRFAFI